LSALYRLQTAQTKDISRPVNGWYSYNCVMYMKFVEKAFAACLWISAWYQPIVYGYRLVLAEPLGTRLQTTSRHCSPIQQQSCKLSKMTEQRHCSFSKREKQRTRVGVRWRIDNWSRTSSTRVSHWDGTWITARNRT
jgi:hypothetical protein